MEETKQEVVKTEGSIKYTIIQQIDGRIDINVETSLENNMVCLMMANSISGKIVEELRVKKTNTKNPKLKKHLEATIKKGSEAKFGLKMLSEYVQSVYRNFK